VYQRMGDAGAGDVAPYTTTRHDPVVSGIGL
jgi:hypothetical protein